MRRVQPDPPHAPGAPLRTAALLTLLTPASLAQSAGEVLWKTDLYPTPGTYKRMSQLAVASDGTVYLVTDRLNAIAPDGEILWTASAGESYVDIGPDGTVYTAITHPVIAYNPDGTYRWVFAEPPLRGFGITVGPTIGPAFSAARRITLLR